VGPLAALLVFAGVVLVLHHQLARLHIRERIRAPHSIPRTQVLAGSVHGAQLLAADHLRKCWRCAYLRGRSRTHSILFTSFIAYSFGHTLGVRRLLPERRSASGCTRPAGITAIEVATNLRILQSVAGIGWATVAGLSLFFEPAHAARVLHLHHHWSVLVARCCWAR